MVFQHFSLLDGSFVIWKGPITDNSGKVQLAKDTVADDQFLGGLNFYVKALKAKCRATSKRLHRVRPAACGLCSVFWTSPDWFSQVLVSVSYKQMQMYDNTGWHQLHGYVQCVHY
jgi:hypothetical protein